MLIKLNANKNFNNVTTDDFLLRLKQLCSLGSVLTQEQHQHKGSLHSVFFKYIHTIDRTLFAILLLNESDTLCITVLN